VVHDRLRLPVRFDAADLLHDAAGFTDDDWIPHFNKGVYEGDWSGIALRSVGGVAGQLYPDPAADAPFADTPLMARCPHVREVLSWFECPLSAVRFLRLGPGSCIKEHTDLNLGYEDGEVRIHIPVATDDKVEFILAGERVPMRAGEAWYLDHNRRHAVVNSGPSPRIHLVMDCVVNDWLAGVLEPTAIAGTVRNFV
jgi:hypothetical protein